MSKTMSKTTSKAIKKHSGSTTSVLGALSVMSVMTGPWAVAATNPNGPTTTLEEITVTAQKREQPLQEAPVAISVLSEAQLAEQGVTSLAHLIDGSISSLRVQKFPDDPSILAIAIRGNGPGDIIQTTREGSVAVYLDDIYLGRAQGMMAEVADLQQVEVLRGPQGTLFGRNATGGAISLVSKKPSGEFGIQQTVGIGRYNEVRSATHIDLPEWNTVKTKFSYLHSERDGWFKNTAEGEPDFNAYDNDSARISLDWQVNDATRLGYSYDRSDLEVTQSYYQIDEDIGGAFNNEPDRVTRSRRDMNAIEPTHSRHDGHALTLSVDLSEHLSFKSLSSYRNLDNDARHNYGGAFYFNGFILQQDTDQEQTSQELRLVGDYDRFDFVAGLYYYREDSDTDIRNLFSYDQGFAGNTPGPIEPPTTVNLFDGQAVPPTNMVAKLTSKAIYGQATWTPPIGDDKLKLTLGFRKTDDDKSGRRSAGGFVNTFAQKATPFNPTMIVDYDWSEAVSTYAKWSSAFRGGGVNVFSRNLTPFSEETIKTAELGLKSEFWDRRVRLNLAVFQSEYDDIIVDVYAPDDINKQFTESINAANKVGIDGAEVDVTVVPIAGLVLGLNYTYLDGDMPLQPNPLDEGGEQVKFNIAQTPKHAGAMTIDYTLQPLFAGTPTVHFDISSTDEFHYFPTNSDITDTYTLMNARLSLKDIALGTGERSHLAASLWVNNITDEEYAAFALSLERAARIKTYGTPRTYGLDVTYTF
ncbi:MAG: TonB-dependent receptor [Exilibacterium sp.]